ncbi:NAD/NADP octopine/nopaline dehydrogenase family protein [Streptomyces pathocidini]|uniref:NAD/NADP octopine/nopaline dehydrogenase family protein n=1 Tax=Streptomyces pathocidini TaxID=1650571 RepID=A0ABW7UKJ9_9ACTN|nr:NAD/NADP octopine/nopaline dehydrogenase family protein [Streptomyces pathocidini]
MTDIVIIGAGHVGLTLLADLQLTKPFHGCTAVLLAFDHTGVLDQRARDRTRLTMENLVTGAVEGVVLDPAQFGSLWSEQGHEALQRAGTIFVTVPDIPDLRLDLLDHLERTVDLAGKLIVFVRGGQGGQPVLAKWIRDNPQVQDTSVVLVEDSFYGTRVLGERIQFKRKISVNVSVYSPEPDAALATLRGMFPLGTQISRPSWPDMAVTDGIDLQFNPLGYIIHVGVALDPANLAKTREGIRYTHYVEGISPELATRLDLLDQERVMLAEAMGAQAQTFPDIIQRQYGLPPQPTFHTMMQSCRPIYRSLSSGSIEELRTSRVLLEDMPAFHTIRWLASACGIDMPYTSAYFDDVLDRLKEIGADWPRYTAYLPYLDKIDGSTAELKELLNHPHRKRTEV